MRYVVLLSVVFASAAFAQDAGTPSDAPVKTHCEDPDAPPDIPGVSVCLHAGQPAPFSGYENTFDEEKRRAKKLVKKEGTLDSEAKNDSIVSKPVFVTVICVAAAGIAAAISSGVCAATNCLNQPQRK